MIMKSLHLLIWNVLLVWNPLLPTSCGFSFHLQQRSNGDHTVPSYFRKLDANGELVHRGNAEYDKILQHPINNKIRFRYQFAELKVSPSIVRNGGEVTVSWFGVVNPLENDIIAFYCPYNDDPFHYLDYFTVSKSSSWYKGYGNYSVIVYNMRTECKFRYYTNTDSSYLVAVSNILKFADGGSLAPLQGHIALTGDSTEMRVMWVGGKVSNPLVRYGLSNDLNMVEKKVKIHSYSAEDMCESPANTTGFWHPGYIYDIVLRKLKPNTRYYYQYGTTSHMSKVFHFTTAIPAGESVPYKFIVYGDMGIEPYPQGITTGSNVYNDIRNDDNYRFVFHNGDISYAKGYAYIWDQWFKIIEPYATLVPYMVGIGNHEQDHITGGEKDPSGAPGESSFRPVWGTSGKDSGGECGVPMYNRFHMPDNGNGVWWYSYDYGLVHFIMMSTEHDFTPESRQYKWLEEDLKHIDRNTTPWVIFGGHRAMYTSQIIPSEYVVSVNMQRLFEGLLYKYKVDIAFWAHFHSYERTCKVYKGKCCPHGVIHIVVGSGGRQTSPNAWFSKEWSVFHRSDYGYGRVSVANATSLYWEWVENRSHKPLDSVWMHKL